MTAAERLASGWPGVLAAGIAGAALPLAFAPLELAWMAVLAPAVLFAVAAAAPRRRALQAAYAFGLGQFGVGVSWVFVSIHEYGGAGPVLAGGVTAAFVAFLALFPVLAVALGRALGAGRGVRLLVALPSAWVLVEWLRTWLFTGFPWLFLGYAALDTPLAGLVPVAGVLGLSLVAALLAGAVAWLATRPSLRSGAAAAVVAAATTAMAAAAAAGQPWTERDGDPRSVALLQGNFSQDIKWDPAYMGRIQARYARLTREHAGADIIVWPETAIPARLDRVRTYLDRVTEAAGEAGSTVVLGIPRQDPEAGTLHNSIAVLGPEPRFYDKRHLVPFGEYVPFREWVGRRLDFLGAPMADYTPGGPPQPLPVGEGLALGGTVCYEVAYPSAVRATAAASGMLVNVSNDAWFGDSLAPHQHLQKARMRAAETERWMLRATNTGITAIIGPGGEVVARAAQFRTGSLEAEAEPRGGATPYVRWGDAPVLGLVAGVLALAGGLRLWRRARRPRAG